MLVMMNPWTGITCLDRCANICIIFHVSLVCAADCHMAPVSMTKVMGESAKMVTLGVLGDAGIFTMNTVSSLDVGNIIS